MMEFKNQSGIYQIKNTVNGKVYVGKTKCFYRRHCQYVSGNRNNSEQHINRYLLASFRKYGFDAFEFSVLEFCSTEACAERELFWMLELESTNRDKGYNLRMDSSTGMIVHPDTSAKISENLKGQWAAGIRDGHAEKLAESWNSRDRDAQGKMFSKYLTQWIYEVHYPDGLVQIMSYRCLAARGFKSVLSNFYRNEADEAVHKGLLFKRFKEQGYFKD